METVEKREDIANLKENRIIGSPELVNSLVKFEGRGNILFCEDNVTIKNSKLNFNADDSVIYFGATGSAYSMYAALHNDCVMHFGYGNVFNDGFRKQLIVMLSEQRHFFAGDQCLFSFGVCIRNSDPHLIYDAKTLKRINPTKSVFIGDHVWLGQDMMLFKGSRIDSGSIIGAGSIVSGKRIPNNEIWAGSPCKKIRSDAFWDFDNVHFWREDMTEDGSDYSVYAAKHKNGLTPDRWVFKYDPKTSIDFDELDKRLSAAKCAEKKLEILKELNEKKAKNRFVHDLSGGQGQGFFGRIFG